MIIYSQEEKELQIPIGIGNINVHIEGGSGGGITKEEVQQMIDDAVIEAGAVTEEMVDNKDEAVKEWVEENYANKDELEGYATEEYVNQQIIEAGSVTTEIVEEMIDEALVDYYTQTETDAEIDEKVSSALNDYYTKQEVDDMIPEVNNFATKDELQEVENTLKDLDATQVKTNISTDIFDFDNVEDGLDQITQAVEYQSFNKVDKSELKDYAKKTEIPDVSNFVTDSQVDSKIDNQIFKTINNQSIKGSGYFFLVKNINGIEGIWQGSKAEYDALDSHSNNVLYILKG